MTTIVCKIFLCFFTLDPYPENPGAPCDVRRYRRSLQGAPRRVTNEIDYRKINVEINSGTAVSTRKTSLKWRH